MRTFLEKIKGLREDNDLTQTQIAEILGTSQTMYARFSNLAGASVEIGIGQGLGVAQRRRETRLFASLHSLGSFALRTSILPSASRLRVELASASSRIWSHRIN